MIRREKGCIALISAPSDWKIYTTFRSVALRWRDDVLHQNLYLEHDVPILPQFTDTDVPPLLFRIFNGARALISRLDLVLGPLRIEYLRSGGHPPFLQSFFDEIHMTIDEGIDIEEGVAEDEIRQIVAALFRDLHVKAIAAEAPFDGIFHVPPATIVGGANLRASLWDVGLHLPR